tara:strand:+ start:314 stop:451 length:138 start_codon:yes stop_codon:yes gene_type:complete
MTVTRMSAMTAATESELVMVAETVTGTESVEIAAEPGERQMEIKN